MNNDRRICIGMISGAHGIKGLVKIRSFTEDPEAIASYGALTDESGEQKFLLTLKDDVKDGFTALIDGVRDRNGAEALHGTRLYVTRDQMPKLNKKEFYAGDLLGLKASDKAGQSFGSVMDVHDHGAGTFLEVGRSRKDSFMLPFNDVYVPEIDLGSGTVLIHVPEGWLNKDKPGESEISERAPKPPKKEADQ